MRRLFVEEQLPFEEALRWATDEEATAARSFAPARGREYLSWRAIVRRELGRDTKIAYDSIGAPMLTNHPLHISVSHCQGRIAVGLSDKPCAVDIERSDRDFSRALPRYLAPDEQRISSHPLFPAIAWCAKETLYKYAGRRELDLLRDLHIDAILFPENESGTATAAPTSDLIERSMKLSPLSPEDILSDGSCGTLCGHYTNMPPETLHFYQKKEFVVVFLFE